MEERKKEREREKCASINMQYNIFYLKRAEPEIQRS